MRTGSSEPPEHANRKEHTVPASIDSILNALAPDFAITTNQLAALVLVLAISVVLLAYGLGRQAAKLDRRIKALEAALSAVEISHQ